MERETWELETQEPEERSGVFQKVVKAIVIGASVVGLGFLWRNRFGSLQSHTIPPIIIKSFDDGAEPIEVESRSTLQESSSLTNDSDALTTDAETLANEAYTPTKQAAAPAVQRVYTLPGFGTTKYVKVLRKNTATGSSAAPQEYRSNAGLSVNMWLQHKQGGVWHDEPRGPHIVVAGTMADFPLTCDRLSVDRPAGPGTSRRKRSYNRNKNWRIGKVQVGSDTPLSTTGFNDVAIIFEDHIH